MDEEAGENSSLVHPLVLLKPSLAQDPEAKGKKIKRRPGNISTIMSPFLALGAHQKSQHEKNCRVEYTGFIVSEYIEP